MRAVESELDTLDLKALVLEMIWALKGAMLQVANDNPNGGEHPEKFLKDWQQVIDDATEKVGDISVHENPVHTAAMAKLDEFTEVIERTKRTYREVSRQLAPGDPAVPNLD